MLLIERSVSDEDMLAKVYPQLTQAQYIAVGIGISAGAIDAEPALLSAKYVVVHNKRFGRMSCLAGKAKFVMANAVNDKFFIAKGKDSELYVVYEIDHSRKPPIVSTNADILRVSEHNGYDTRFVKLSQLR